jgi:threonine dehydratase
VQILGPETEVYVKLELFQHTGTFKARGALNNILSLSEEQKQRGVTACSAGNHAIAVSFAAKQAGKTIVYRIHPRMLWLR